MKHILSLPIRILAATIILVTVNLSGYAQHHAQHEVKASHTFKDQKMADAYLYYTKVVTALAKDDFKESQKSVVDFRKAIQEVKGAEKVAELAAKLEASENLKAQRKAFAPFSEAFTKLIKENALSGGKLYLANCPMANGNKGASWLSNEKKIRNPYIGTKMLSCGTIKEEIN